MRHHRRSTSGTQHAREELGAVADALDEQAFELTLAEANRHREDLPMLLRVMELEVAARKIGPPTKTEHVPPRIGAVEPDILSLTEAAEFVGMSAVWLRKHFRRLPEGIVIQRARRCAVSFRRDSLREWRDNGRGLGPLLRKGRE